MFAAFLHFDQEFASAYLSAHLPFTINPENNQIARRLTIPPALIATADDIIELARPDLAH